MADLIGRFYFKLTANGNLLGEYSNNHQECKRVSTESATRKNKRNDTGDDPSSSSLTNKFIGEYISTWHEITGCESADLKIEPKSACIGIFSVNWKSITKDPAKAEILFEGEAMLCDDILIGDYRTPGITLKD